MVTHNQTDTSSSGLVVVSVDGDGCTDNKSSEASMASPYHANAGETRIGGHKAGDLQLPANSFSSAASPTLSSATSARPTMLSDTAKAALEITFPKCSICETSWFDPVENKDNNGNDGDLKPAAKTSPPFERRRRIRPSHFDLLPMPICKCTTKLVLPPLPYDASSTIVDTKTFIKALSKVQAFPFKLLAICKSCLQQRIDTSDEVIEHDYHQGHIENGQRNVKFTVNTDCVQCHTKFSRRALEKMLKNTDSFILSTNEGKKKRTTNWHDAVYASIQLVGQVKRQMRRDRRRGRRLMRSIVGEDLDENTQQWWEQHGCCGEGGDSDDCYSYTSCSDSDIDEDHKKKSSHRVESGKGELRELLMQKDPQFRALIEGEDYAKKLELEEKARLKELEEKEMRDLELAKKIAAELGSADAGEPTTTMSVQDETEENDRQMALRLQEKYKRQSIGGKAPKKRNTIIEALKKQSPTTTYIPTVALDAASNSDIDESDGNKLRDATRGKRESDPIEVDEGDRKCLTTKRSTLSIGNATTSHSKPAAKSPTPERFKSSPTSVAHATNHNENLSGSTKKRSLDNNSSFDGASAAKNPRQNERNSLEAQSSDTTATEESLSMLVNVLGFCKGAAERCLKDADGDANLAASMLYSEEADLAQQERERRQRRKRDDDI